MVEIQPATLNYLKNSTFEIKIGATAANDYAGSCRSIRVEPTGATATFYGMKPTAVWEENGGWNITFEFADDYESATSLWNYLFTNDGQPATITFAPKAGGQKFTVTATLKSAGIGGTTREVATSQVQLACSAPVKAA